MQPHPYMSIEELHAFCTLADEYRVRYAWVDKDTYERIKILTGNFREVHYGCTCFLPKKKKQ